MKLERITRKTYKTTLLAQQGVENLSVVVGQKVSFDIPFASHLLRVELTKEELDFMRKELDWQPAPQHGDSPPYDAATATGMYDHY